MLGQIGTKSKPLCYARFITLPGLSLRVGIACALSLHRMLATCKHMVAAAAMMIIRFVAELWMIVDAGIQDACMLHVAYLHWLAAPSAAYMLPFLSL